jgi:membrane fusion protein
MPDGSDDGEKLPLFRKIVVEKQSSKSEGAIVLARPILMRTVGWFGVLFLALSVVFIFTFDYSKNSIIQGELMPEGGNATVIASQSGYLSKINIDEGAEVKIGDTLFEINSARTAGFEFSEIRLTALLESKRNMLFSQMEIQNSLWKQQKENVCRKKMALKEDIASTSILKKMQEDRLMNSKVSNEKIVALRAKGFISEAQWLQHENELSGERSKLVEASRAEKLAIRDYEQASVECERQQKDAALMKSNSDLALNGVAQEIVEQQLRNHFLVTSPVSGTIASVTLSSEGSIQAGETLATIIPKGRSLEAVLLAPSSAVATISPNQKVNLKFDAFPYQRYGTVSGVVRAIDRSPTKDSAMKSTQTNVAFYKVFVKLYPDSNLMKEKGAAFKTGMRVEAVVETDRRKLLSWMLDPLSNLNK